MNNLSIAGGIAFILGVIALIVFYPFVLIWSLNTLFASLSIPYSFTSWIAIVILNLGTFGNIRYNLNQIRKKL